MPLPKSVVKLKKGNVEYTSNVDRCNYYIEELSRRALLDVGRFLKYNIKKQVNDINEYTRRAAKSKSKNMGDRYQIWVRKKETDLQVGVENTKYANTAWWADQAELGTNNQPKRGFIRETTYNNIDTIREIESKYLSAIEDELEAQSLIDESEVVE